MPSDETDCPRLVSLVGWGIAFASLPIARKDLDASLKESPAVAFTTPFQ